MDDAWLLPQLWRRLCWATRGTQSSQRKFVSSTIVCAIALCAVHMASLRPVASSGHARARATAARNTNLAAFGGADAVPAVAVPTFARGREVVNAGIDGSMLQDTQCPTKVWSSRFLENPAFPEWVRNQHEEELEDEAGGVFDEYLGGISQRWVHASHRGRACQWRRPSQVVFLCAVSSGPTDVVPSPAVRMISSAAITLFGGPAFGW